MQKRLPLVRSLSHALMRGLTCSLIFGTVVTALLLPLRADAGIESTRHNLIQLESAASRALGPAVCVFCHTPHGRPDNPQAPMWQPSTKPDPVGFLTYDSLGRSVLGQDTAVGSVSVACLSCHDQTQAADITASLGHPYGVPYRGALSDEAQRAGIVRQIRDSTPFQPASHLKNVTGFRAANAAVIDEVPIWWVDTGNPGRQRSDLQLYSRVLNANEAMPFVECASCHDPHNEQSGFLRQTDTNSLLCRSCHEGW